MLCRAETAINAAAAFPGRINPGRAAAFMMRLFMLNYIREVSGCGINYDLDQRKRMRLFRQDGRQPLR